MDASAWAAWAGAGVAVLGAASMFWIRWRDRPQAEWVAMYGETWQSTSNNEAPLKMTFELQNCGDGAAYLVRPKGVGCRAALTTDRHGQISDQTWMLPTVPPGGTIGVIAWVNDPVEGVPLTDVAVRIEWLRTPTRHRDTRVVKVDFAAFADPRLDEPGWVLVLHEWWWVRWFMTPRQRARRRRSRLLR